MDNVGGDDRIALYSALGGMCALLPVDGRERGRVSQPSAPGERLAADDESIMSWIWAAGFNNPNVTFVEYDRGERRADLAIHAGGVTLGAVAAVHLAITALGKPSLLAFGLIVYGASLFAMLICSALYNLATPSPRKAFLRRLDHAAIYVMIAGTYTPFTLGLVPSAVGVALLLFVWMAAAVGVALKLTYPRRYEAAATVLYLALGWCFLIEADAFFAVLTDGAGALLLCGGLLYTGGVAIHHWRSLRFHNALWHAIVLVAAGCHYAVVLTLIE